MKANDEKALCNGYIGKISGYRVNGKSYDTDGNEGEEVHEDDCFCCCKNLLGLNKRLSITI